MPIGQHKLVTRALARVFKTNPPKHRYPDTWDVDVPDFLTWKLSLHLALTGAFLASELGLLNIEFMKDKGDSIVFVLPGLTKTRSQKHPGCSQIDFKVFELDSKLDVVQCICDYIQRSQQWRVSPQYHFLLLATTKPHKLVVTSTISGWLVKVMEVAGSEC